MPETRGEFEAVAPGSSDAMRAEQLVRLIRAEIREGTGAISFERYMELALYAPGLGYYDSDTPKFSAAGDFVTAPEISPLFSRCLAGQIAEVLTHLGGGDVLEVGAGSGMMAAAVLRELEALGADVGRYLIFERSAALVARQRKHLQTAVPESSPKVHWLDEWPASDFRGVVVANELLDALPASRFEVFASGLREACIEWRDDGFAWSSRPPRAEVESAYQKLTDSLPAALPVGYCSELSLAQRDWVQSLAQVLERGVALLIDYGYPRQEFYHPQRQRGTLACYYRHRMHDDPRILTGLQDISVHVDFTTIAEVAAAAGLRVQGFTSQANFLLSLDLLALAQEASADAGDYAAAAAQIRRLTLPGEMGEAVKVMALGRGVELPLLGFRGRDLLGRL